MNTNVHQTAPVPSGGAKTAPTELRVGDRIKDNDPRMPNRVLTVTRIWFTTDGGRFKAKAVCDDGVGRPHPILLRRIYTDGKPRKSGFSRVPA